MRKLFVLVAALLASFVIAMTGGTAHADDIEGGDGDGATWGGYMTLGEFDWIDVTIPDANRQKEVDDHCHCYGKLYRSMTRNGNPAKIMEYKTPDTASIGRYAYVWYVKRDADGKWYAYRKALNF